MATKQKRVSAKKMCRTVIPHAGINTRTGRLKKGWKYENGTPVKATGRKKPLKKKVVTKGLKAVNIAKTPIPSHVLRTMPQKVINYIAKNFDAVYSSPYSNSYYSKPGQSWDHTPENQIRVANHWNFYSRNYNDPYSVAKLHAETDIPVQNNTHWTIAKKENGIYKVIMSLPVAEKSKRNFSHENDLLAQKEPNEILYKFKLKQEQIQRKKEAERIENAKLKTISQKSLLSKISKLDMGKNSVVIADLKNLKNNTRIRPVYYQGSGRNTKTVDNTLFFIKALKELNLRYKQGNDAPRGGKIGEYIDVLTKIK